MIDWTHDLPAPTLNAGYRLVRCPPLRPLKLIVLADKILATRTHYTKSRTTPCLRPDCPACDDGLAFRWHAYLAAICIPSKEKVILELTAQAAEQLKPAISGFGSLRGLELVADRPSQRPNGRVRLTFRAGSTPPEHLPPEPNTQQILLHIWGCDDAPCDSNHRAKGLPFTRVAPTPANSRPQNPSATP